MSEPWTGAGLGLDDLQADEAVRRAFPDLTPFEYHCAMTPSQYPYAVLGAKTAVGRVAALREARIGRADLSQAEWEQCVLLLYSSIGEHQRQNPAELLSAIAALRPAPGEFAPGNGLTVRRIVDRLTGWTGDFPPPQDDFALDALGVTDRRVRQVLGRAHTTWRAVIEEARALR